jgi:hypothetical protein
VETEGTVVVVVVVVVPGALTVPGGAGI